jgi:glycosyltransferase involved in cell wall biosynthesis
VVPALPAPCDCPDVARGRDDVLFLGAFDERKGVPQLLEAWPEVRRAHPAARLTMIGTGPLAERVAWFAAGDDHVSVVVDPPRAEIHAALRRAAVLVLLSQPTATWREQVGLPLVEGLAHGCAVVASSETGLATWLAAHGHAVLPPSAAPDAIGTAVADALAARRPAASVRADLPEVDGRLEADRWLFTGAG